MWTGRTGIELLLEGSDASNEGFVLGADGVGVDGETLHVVHGCFGGSQTFLSGGELRLERGGVARWWRDGMLGMDSARDFGGRFTEAFKSRSASKCEVSVLTLLAVGR